MDLPSHLLYTYAFEKLVTPALVVGNPKFIMASLTFSAIPDILETTPFLIYLVFNRKKYGLKNIKSIIAFTADINHNRQDEYSKNFAWASKISFYTHSFLVYIIIAVLLYFWGSWLFLPFVIGLGLHLLTDMFMHDDYFSARPLYPVSNFYVPGFFTWYKQRNFSKYNYALLVLIYIALLA